jgi:hypothetical protein
MPDDTTTRNKRRLILAGIVGVLLIIVVPIVVFFYSNALVYVSVDTAAKDTITTYAVSGDKSDKVGEAGLLTVSRGTKSLLVTAGDNVKTQTNINLPWYGIASKNIKLAPDQNADKVAYLNAASSACASYDQASGQLLGYLCQRYSPLVTYETNSNDWANKKLADFTFANAQVLPYLGGVIGMSVSEAQSSILPRISKSTASVASVAADGHVSTLAVPDGLDSENAVAARLFTDTKDASDSHFGIVDLFGNIYLGTLSADKKSATYRQIDAPQDYSYRYNQTACSFAGSTVYCYRGLSANAASAGTATKTQPQIIKLSFDNDAVDTYSLSEPGVIDGFYTTTSGNAYATVGKTVYALNQHDKVFTATSLTEAADTVAAGDNLYFVQSNGVWQLDPATGDTHQVFYSPNITIKSVYPVSGKIFLLGTTKHGGDATYAYALTDQADTTPGKRTIDLLPASTDDVDGLLGSDFVGDKLLLKVAASDYDNSAKKDGIFQAVQALGVSFDENNVTFAK